MLLEEGEGAGPAVVLDGFGRELAGGELSAGRSLLATGSAV